MKDEINESIEYGCIKAKKSLGQNFLTSKDIGKKIVIAGNLQPLDTVIEIGPGKGFLTDILLNESDAHIVAIEKDDRIPEILQGRFKKHLDSGRLEIRHEDILNSEYIFPSSYKIIANIPYYITGLIIRSFLARDHQPECMILLVQKEVGERIISKDGKESILSLSVKVYGLPSIVGNVSKIHFSPSPKVDSVILKIDSISKEFFINNKIDESTFFSIIKQAFNQKRKQLGATILKNQKSSELESYLVRRPETIRLKEWVHIIKEIKIN